jgi:hypothetical protein
MKVILLTKSKEDYFKAFMERYGICPSDEELRAFIELYESKKGNT